MAKLFSSAQETLARIVKGLMAALVIPLGIGLLLGILDQLELAGASGQTFRRWIEWGFVTYVGIHLLLYRPVGVFRASHRIFSTLAVWLFGGQVASVEGGGGKGKTGKGAKGETGAQGSTLVAFSPYVIPLYLILVSGAAWLLARWVDRTYVDGPAGFLIGMTAAFHWLMTADDLQGQRDRWHLETYLLALGLVFVMTLLLGGACLPWSVPGFAFTHALGDGLLRTQAIYTAVIHQLFF